MVGVRRGRGRARDRSLAHGRLAAGGAASTRARRCSRTRFTSAATSRGRSRCSCGLVGVRAGWPVGRRAGGALRRGPRARRGGPAHAAQRRRAHGSGSGRRRRGRCARRSRRSTRPWSCVGFGCVTRAGARSRTSSSASSPGAAVGQGHAAADRVEAAVHRALPGSDVVVHVEPLRPRRPCAGASPRGGDGRRSRPRDPQPRR